MNEHQHQHQHQQPEAGPPGGERPAETPGPRIWVGSLADYNQGDLYGVWIDAARDPNELRTDIQAMLANSPTPGAEEWGIFDHDGFHGARIHEYESLEVVAQLALGITEHGGAYAAWAQLHDNDAELLAQFSEAYLGQFESRAAFAQHVIDDLGVEEALATALPDWLRAHVSIDYVGIAHDLEISGDVSFNDAEGGVWVFDGKR